MLKINLVRSHSNAKKKLILVADQLLLCFFYVFDQAFLYSLFRYNHWCEALLGETPNIQYNMLPSTYIFRYLWKTFTYAYHYSKPDVIVFLGDLFDEGSKATQAEYALTLDRFNSIFAPIKFTKVSDGKLEWNNFRFLLFFPIILV